MSDAVYKSFYYGHHQPRDQDVCLPGARIARCREEAKALTDSGPPSDNPLCHFTAEACRQSLTGRRPRAPGAPCAAYVHGSPVDFL